jgi:chromosome partitioning protein
LIIGLDQNRTLQQWALRFPAQLKKIQVEAVAEKDLIERLKTLYHSFNGFVLIDVAVTTTIVAATIAHLTITPTKLSAPDIIEAVKLNREIRKLGERVGKPINHRVLLNELSAIWPTYQRSALTDITARKNVARSLGAAEKM